MDHARDDVLASTALALNQDWDIGAGHFVQTLPKRLHDLRMTEYDRFGRKFSQ